MKSLFQMYEMVNCRLKIGSIAITFFGVETLV